MLDPNEKYVFDGMVMHLRAADPAFERRLDRLVHPRRRLRVALAVLLWTLVPVCILLGGWTGLLLAMLASGYGAHLMTRRTGPARPAGGFSWWSSSPRRPSAPF
ncbi:DUF3040 domain-containing protein [Jidongwangia harbinensis]|uniref:DUF3040 domain-containing protein n=1 Tax=Jidongwangia harbinensis TaxID=2878561 RepID=UPI001CD96FFA|nr:DUF3040 domain-containing protein [Jidongwangia harbinensis]MCA2215748.1 DUF3040 domain-containing protein [Jidongwangia harbinensis]